MPCHVVQLELMLGYAYYSISNNLYQFMLDNDNVHWSQQSFFFQVFP